MTVPPTRRRPIAIGLAALLLLFLLPIVANLPIAVPTKARPFDPAWPVRPVTAQRPAQLSWVAPLDGLAELWVHAAGPASARLQGTLIGADRRPIRQVRGDPVERGGQRFHRFTFDPVEAAAGRRLVFVLSPAPESDPAWLPAVVVTPARHDPTGDPDEARQVAFEAVYRTTLGAAVWDLAPRLGSVGSERWAPAWAIGPAAALAIAAGLGLIRLTRRAGAAT